MPEPTIDRLRSVRDAIARERLKMPRTDHNGKPLVPTSEPTAPEQTETKGRRAPDLKQGNRGTDAAPVTERPKSARETIAEATAAIRYAREHGVSVAEAAATLREGQG